MDHHPTSSSSGSWVGGRRTGSTAVKSYSVKSRSSAEMRFSARSDSTKPEEDSYKDVAEIRTNREECLEQKTSETFGNELTDKL